MSKARLDKLSLSAILRDITGTALFTAQPYAIFVPVFWLTSVLTNADTTSLLSISIWTIANTVSMLACWALILFIDKKVVPNRDRKPANLVVVLLLSALIGGFKGFATSFLAGLLGESSSLAELASRSLQTAVLGLVTIPALAVFSAALKRFQEERDALVVERVAQAEASIAATDKYVLDLSQVKAALSEVREFSGSAGDQEIPALLREVVQTHLRPMTHRLWEVENSKQPRYSLGSLSRLSFINGPFSPLSVAIILAMGSVFTLMQGTGTIEGLSRSALLGATVYAGFELAKFVHFKTLKLSVVWYLAACAGISATYVWLSTAILGQVADFTFATATVVIAIWLAQTGYMVAVAKTMLEARAAIRAQLQQAAQLLSLDEEAVKVRRLVANREIANHLHANVQNKLLALALRLEAGEAPPINEELASIEKMLDMAGTGSSTTDLAQGVKELASRWNGICSIYISGALPNVDIGKTDVVLKILNEAVNNAVRHGFAKNLHLQLATEHGGLVLRIDDDGIGPRTGTPGLGSRYFATVSQSWQLSAKPSGGSLLEVRL